MLVLCLNFSSFLLRIKEVGVSKCPRAGHGPGLGHKSSHWAAWSENNKKKARKKSYYFKQIIGTKKFKIKIVKNRIIHMEFLKKKINILLLI